MEQEVLIIYSSLTGSTQATAFMIAEALKKEGLVSDLRRAQEIEARDLLDYPYLLIGSYTYGRHANIPEELQNLYQAIHGLDLSRQYYATFGSGDRYYEKFCQAAWDFDEALSQAGAMRVVEPVCIQKYPDADFELQMIHDLALAFSQVEKRKEGAW